MMMLVMMVMLMMNDADGMTNVDHECYTPDGQNVHNFVTWLQ